MKLISLEDFLKISIDVVDKVEEACGLELGRFDTAYRAEWVYGRYCGWNIEKKILARYSWRPVALKVLSGTNQKNSKKFKEFSEAKIEQSITTHASNFWPYSDVESWTMLKD
ncbi:34228_t:CDS:2, partial [Gigaspora margarita]